jgi:hypothetical protein
MKTGKILHYGLLLAGSLLAAPAPGFAADKPESVEMRITRLEKELAELKALMKQKSETAHATAQVPVTPSPAIAAPAAKQESQGPLSVSLGSGVKVQLYGFARLDASWDSGQIYPGNIALWAQPYSLGRNDGEWNITAGATRIGFNLNGPDTEKLKLSGNIEFDFLSSNSTSENNQLPRLRHAYLKAYWPASDFSIIAGQTWDLVASQIPFTDDPALMWDAGNIGTRHPQVRLTKGFKTGEKGRIELAVAASRTIGEKSTVGYDSGKDAAIPTIQGRVALSGPVFVDNKPATIAVSGHYGQEQWDINPVNDHKTVDTWSCNLELSLPLSKNLLFAGEYFTGANLDDFWGGISQGVNAFNPNNPKAIRSHGGWAAMKYTFSPTTTFSLGAGIDDPNDNDLINPSAKPRTLNRSIFANVINQVTPNFILGFQVGEWLTDYMGLPESHAVRAQSSMTYKF